MSKAIPDKFRDLISKKAFAHLATVSADGSPQVTPVWIDGEGGFLRINSALGRAKDRNMRKNARVAVSILDPDNPYRHLAVQGRVAEITEAGAEEHIDALAKKYLGLDRYPNRKPGERRVIYKIEPLNVSTMG